MSAHLDTLASLVVDRAPRATSRAARFERLITTRLNDLYRYACWLTHDPATADDLVQETMLRAWKSLDRLQNPKAAKSWLITILRRENARRFERYQPPQSTIPTEELAAARSEYDTSTEAFVLRRALAHLPERYREPLLLQIIHGYSQKEIAARLGLSPAGAGSRLFRARRKLREMLEGDGETVA